MELELINTARPTIGIVGCFQNGKSTLVNCLLDDKVAITGDGRATTSISTLFSWGEVQNVTGICSKLDTRHSIPFKDYASSTNLPDLELAFFEVNLWKPLLQYVNIVDTPGFNNSDKDNATATNALDGMDLVIFVACNKTLSQAELNILEIIAKKGLSFIVILNCKENSLGLWEPASSVNQRICQSIESSLRAVGHSPYPINGQYVWPINLAWFWYATQHLQALDDELSQDMVYDIQRFMKKKFNISKYDYHLIAEKSNFIPFRQTIHRIAAHHQYRNSNIGRKAEAYITISKTCSQNKDLANSMLFAERACYTAPLYIPALHNRAVVCYERNELEEVINSTTEILGIDARNIDTLFFRAKVFFQKEDFNNAKKDLNQIAELLESQWNIVWEESEKASNAAKLIDAYLMKIECDQRECILEAHFIDIKDSFVKALSDLRYIINCKQKPLEKLNDDILEFTVFALSAALELRQANYDQSLDSVKNALAVFKNKEIKIYAEIGELVSDYKIHRFERSKAIVYTKTIKQEESKMFNRLKVLCRLFKIDSGDLSLFGETVNLRDELYRILWKGCCAKHNNIEIAVNEFTDKLIPKHVNHIGKFIWKEEPEFVPYFISLAGQKQGYDIDIKSYVQEYFDYTEDINKTDFYNKASQKLYSVKSKLNELYVAVELRCKIQINTALMMNSVQITNLGLPVLSEIEVGIYYLKNQKPMTKKFSYLPSLKKGQEYKWVNAFEEKAHFFGGNKITDIKIKYVASNQGTVKFE